MHRAGLTIAAFETMGKTMVFEPWADNMSVPADVRGQLLSDLRSVTGQAREWLRPDVDTSAPSFVLTEGLFVAVKP